MIESSEKQIPDAYQAGRDAVSNHRSLILLLTGIMVLIVNLLRNNPSSGLIGLVVCVTAAWLVRKRRTPEALAPPKKP
jgi:hypothetical protein